jgi:CDP-Glycerol:Poly(glycerophosphate) glycerophosphotransferase
MNIEKSAAAKPPPPHVGFLFNHDQIHQIAHSLPVAIALAAASPDLQISIATTNSLIDAEVTRLMGVNVYPNLKRVQLEIGSLSSRLMKKVLGRLLPADKLLIYRENLDYFSSLNALVVTERTSLILKNRYGLKNLKMILIDHGAGDRAIGFGASTADFDNILAAGPKIKDRLIAEAGVAPSKITITGYPKFDAVAQGSGKLPFHSNGHPTVLYNPHLSPHLSSWFKHGRDVLDWFVAHPEYNLIFAPHIMLFQRKAVFTVDKFRMALPGVLDKKYMNAPNIYIDLGSSASTDMTYTNAADIYLGDVSSQIYEFLRIRRPAIFINSHGHDYADDPNYAHWGAGDVIESAGELGAALANAEAKHVASYKVAQKKLFDYTFSLTDEPSSHRAARAIAEIISCG